MNTEKTEWWYVLKHPTEDRYISGFFEKCEQYYEVIPTYTNEILLLALKFKIKQEIPQQLLTTHTLERYRFTYTQTEI